MMADSRVNEQNAEQADEAEKAGLQIMMLLV